MRSRQFSAMALNSRLMGRQSILVDPFSSLHQKCVA